jgi:hypothetical protein
MIELFKALLKTDSQLRLARRNGYYYVDVSFGMLWKSH